MSFKSWKDSLNFMIFIDVLLYISVLSLVLACHTNLIPPIGGSFSCTDNSIEFTYNGDTVSTKVLLVMVIVLFLITVSYKR